MTKIPTCLRSFMSAVSNSENEEILRYLALDCDLGRFYQIFGCDSLRLMLNRIPGDNVRISQLNQNGHTAQALLCSLDSQRWATVWLRESDENWRITDAFPVKLEEKDDPGELSEEIEGLLRGTAPLSVDCRDADLTRFLRDAYRQARKWLTGASSDYSGKVTSM